MVISPAAIGMEKVVQQTMASQPGISGVVKRDTTFMTIRTWKQIIIILLFRPVTFNLFQSGISPIY